MKSKNASPRSSEGNLRAVKQDLYSKSKSTSSLVSKTLPKVKLPGLIKGIMGSVSIHKYKKGTARII